MQKGSQAVWQMIRVIGGSWECWPGFVGAGKRAGVEARNKTVEIGLEYEEVSRLAQVSQTRLFEVVLAKFKDQGVTSLIVSEDLLAGPGADGTGACHPQIHAGQHGAYYTYVNGWTRPPPSTRVRDA